MDNYEQKCLELDKELAELLGWHRFTLLGKEALFGDKPNESLIGKRVPRWTQDDSAAFRLAVEHDVDVQLWDDHVGATYWYYGLDETSGAFFSDFPSKLAAVRYSIVQAVINKLKAANA